MSWAPVPGSIEALRTLRDAQLSVAFVTNTTSISRADVAARLVAAGFTVDESEILTAPAMTAAYLRRHHPGARCAVVGEGDVTADLDGVALVGVRDDPEVVVLAGGGPAFDYDTVNRVFALAVDGVPLVAMHRNLSWATADGLQLDTGAFLAGVEQAAHVEAVTIGKPSAECFAAGLELLGVAAGDALMVGDDLDADVLGAQAAGLVGVLVRTGKFRADVLAQAGSAPDHVVDSFADVPGLLGI